MNSNDKINFFQSVVVAVLCIVVFPLYHNIIAAEELTVSNNKVKVRQGVIQGTELLSPTNGKPLLAFRRIPYAKPPVGKLRFKAPQPIEKFDSQFQATKTTSPCPQYDRKAAKVIGNEDCLYLNIYVPKTSVEKQAANKYPVVIFIHGGYFQYGSASSDVYDPYTFTDNNVIMVSLNYRLGVLGFLSTTDEEIPGNFGLLDQLEALRWIQQNIGYFGGDVNQVTLLGHGAGAASSLFHLLSPLSRGLFSQIIALSGTPTSDMSLQKNPKKWASELGTRLDCYMANSQTLLECLRKHLAEDIVMKAHEMHVFSHYPLIFLPVVERVHKQNGDFLPDTPINLLKEGKINQAPVILGASKLEGKLFHLDASKHYESSSNDFFGETLPEILKVSTSFKHDHQTISKAIKQQYFKNIDEGNANFTKQMQTMYADMLVNRFTLSTAKYLSKAGWPTYLYIVDDDDDNDNENQPNDQDWIYPDELQYIFQQSNSAQKISHTNNPETNNKLRNIVIYTWINFIQTSMPTPTKSPILPITWIPMNPGKIRYLRINAKKPEIVEGYLTNEMKFWDVTVPRIITGHKKDEL